MMGKSTHHVVCRKSKWMQKLISECDGETKKINQTQFTVQFLFISYLFGEIFMCVYLDKLRALWKQFSDSFQLRFYANLKNFSRLKTRQGYKQRSFKCFDVIYLASDKRKHKLMSFRFYQSSMFRIKFLLFFLNKPCLLACCSTSKKSYLSLFKHKKLIKIHSALRRVD